MFIRRITILGLLHLAFFECSKDDSDETAPIETFKVFNASISPIQVPYNDDVYALKIDEANNVWIGANSSTGALFKYRLSTNN